MAKPIADILKQRILVLDGAMGTMIQRYGLEESDFRGAEFEHHPLPLKGNNEMLVLTRPDVIAQIHRQYLEAGADIITTCTFGAQAISQAEYATADLVRRMNLAAARLARAEADRAMDVEPVRDCFVAGSIGPTAKTASLSPDVDDPACRAVDFDMLREAYAVQIDALMEGGVDLLLMETAFDTLNLKAAIAAAEQVFAVRAERCPIMISITIADAAGRMLAGQTPEAMLASVAHADLLSVGVNCSFGAEQMMPYLKILSESRYFVSAHPNAGIPDQMGCYDQSPEMMARSVKQFIDQGLVNIVGGCCGSTPDHIRAIAEVAASAQQLRRPAERSAAWLAGLDPFTADDVFINVGERCNVAGSRKFLRLIKEHSYDEALAIARKQVRDGAMIVDVNMDDAMIDAREQMLHFVNLMASDPEVARLPWMIDSSRFEVVESALKAIQGKAIVNSLSLKEGEPIFIERARRVKELGAALVVMAFDEKGQATTFERKVEVCERAYRILTEQVGFEPRDIIFDPNVLTIATGMPEHDRYALDFIRATEWIHHNLKGARVSGGVSNLSFSFRGNNYLREAMHATFLYHAIKAGMDMAIVNPSAKVMYEDIPVPLREALEDVILCRNVDATERLVALAEQYRSEAEQPVQAISRESIPLQQRLVAALQRGDDEFLEQDLQQALAEYGQAAAIIEGPLMEGMTQVGELFGEGKMFLPQVVKSARTMKRAVEILRPHIESQRAGEGSRAGRFVVATVKGDVHDIGKNIAAVVLACNNFEVEDLGVMVPAERIVEAAANADFVGLSGLITPSLEEMCNVASQLKAAGVAVPLFIGGATTSALHTAVKIAPLYDGPVFYVKDASQNPILAMQLMGQGREKLIEALRAEQQRLRAEQAEQSREVPIEGRPLSIDWSQESIVSPTYTGVRTLERISIEEVRPYINWIHFHNLWRVRPGSAEAEKILCEAEQLLDRMQHTLTARVGFFAARGEQSGIVVRHTAGCECCAGVERSMMIPTPRQSRPDADGVALALSDFVAPEGDYIGAFAITVDRSFAEELEQLKASGEQYLSLLMQSVGDRLVEAASEWLHAKVRRELWGYAPDENLTPREMFRAAYEGIRPAVGYPSLPDQRTIFQLSQLLDVESIGISLTENGAMYPQASVCGLYLASRRAKYFSVK